VAEVKANPSSPHVRASTRYPESRVRHRLRNRRIGWDKPSWVPQIEQGVNGMQRAKSTENCSAENEEDGHPLFNRHDHAARLCRMLNQFVGMCNLI
jgi:hypothetical protein